MDMQNNRRSQPGLLPDPTLGPLVPANTQPPANMENTRLQGRSSPRSKDTHGTLRPADIPAAKNGRPEVENKFSTKVTYGAPQGTDPHNTATKVHSGNLSTQQDPRFEGINGASHGTADYTVNWHGERQKSAFQNSLENFTPVWIAIPMNTGILSILMHQLPYQFHGLQVLSTIMYLLDITLFVMVCCVTILRWTLYPRVAQRKTAASIDELAFLGAGPITLLTLASLTGLIVSNSYWGGHAWSLVAYVMWWIGVLWMMVTCTISGAPRISTMLTATVGVGVCVTIFKSDLIDESSITPTLFVPAVGIATAAVTGGQIVVYAYEISPRLAVPVVIVAYFLAGLAIWLSIILYGVFFQRLMAYGWPAPVKRPTLMILVSYSWTLLVVNSLQKLKLDVRSDPLAKRLLQCKHSQQPS